MPKSGVCVLIASLSAKLEFVKQHGQRTKSLFRLGFDHLRELVLNPSPRNASDCRQSLNFWLTADATHIRRLFNHHQERSIGRTRVDGA